MITVICYYHQFMAVKLDKYSFGSINIDGKTYTTDPLIVDDQVVVDNWWRVDGHSLHMEDFEKVKDLTPAKLVIGRGHNDRMTITDQMRKNLDEAGFDLVDAKTSDAVEIFNKLQENDLDVPLIGGFHLTC